MCDSASYRKKNTTILFRMNHYRLIIKLEFPRRIYVSGHLDNINLGLGHTKLMFRITDFSGHCLGGEGGIKIKIKLTERRLRSMQNQNNFIVNMYTTYSYGA